MNNYKKEYFNDHCYFLIESYGDDYALSYSMYNTISESKKGTKKKVFKKEKLKNIEEKLKQLSKSNEKLSKQEIDELVDEDGTLRGSRVPILNKYLTPKKTMDQTVVASRISNDPVTRGYRVYYGESKIQSDDVINEINMEDAFGYEETKNKDFKETVKTFKEMGIADPEERIERTKQLGKLPNVKKRKGKLKQRLTEKEIEEEKKVMMAKMVEDIISKKNSDGDIINKNDSLSKIIIKNLENIKKLAKKEGISLNKLINVLKKSE